MPVLTPVDFTDDEKLRIARMAFRIAQLGERGENIPEHELDDAIFWIEMGIEDIRLTQKYDPRAYARTTMYTVLAQYAAARLHGHDPYQTQGFLLSYNRWLKGAAQERYTDRPDSWPEYPAIQQRLRTSSYRKFNPDDQNEEDF